MTVEEARTSLQSIFEAGLAEANPQGMLRKRLRLRDGILTVHSDQGELSYDLDRYRRIWLLGVGKASARMALAAEEILGERIDGGLIVVKYGHTEGLTRSELREAGHPVPDDNSRRAADAYLSLAREADEETLIINLISGGGSSLLCSPWSGYGIELSLEEKQTTTRSLLACGAEIQEINTLRKHLSRIKGGRLAEALFPADSLNLILSDVVGDRLDAIASGMTAPDPTSYRQALAVVERYGLRSSLPGRVLEILKRGADGEIPDTPEASAPAFSRTRNILIGTNHLALKAAAAKAAELGFNPVILSSQITGEAREAARFYLGIGADLLKHPGLASLPACVIGGGETTVTIRGEGRGGRNQEMALAFLDALKERPELHGRIAFLSGATDGNDGPTDAAGGIADAQALQTAASRELDLAAALGRNDSYPVLEACGALLKTGPTNTNVCDIQITLALPGPG